MVAGLNGGQTKKNGHHKSQHRTVLKHTHINLAVLIRHSLKYKNTVSQKTFYRDTKLQMSSKISKGGKEARLKEEGGGGGQKGWPYRRLLPLADTQVLRDFSLGFQRGRTGTRPYQKPDQKIRVLCQEEVISLQSSAQAEALRPDSCIQDQGTRKTGRIGRAKEKREERGERSIKSLVPYRSGYSGLLSTSGGDQGQRVPVATVGSGPLAGKLASEYPKWSGCQSQ